MNEIVTQIKNENSKFVKWHTSSARPILIFSTSLKYWIKKDHSIFELEIIFFTIKRSQVRYILHNPNSKIGFTPRNIEPSDFLPHQRFKILDSNTSNLPNSRSIEAIYTKYAKYKLPKSGYGSQSPIGNRIIYNFSSILFNRGVCSAKLNQWSINKIRNEIGLNLHSIQYSSASEPFEHQCRWTCPDSVCSFNQKWRKFTIHNDQYTQC